MYGSLAYKYENFDNGFFLMPELRLGTGVGDDSMNVSGNKVKIEIDSFMALSVRGQYDYRNGAYVYVMPSYANLDITASFNNQSASEDDWEFGIGAGVGYRINKKVSVEASYESYNDADFLSVGFKYAF
jgi:opacity protein-like surface antigen